MYLRKVSFSQKLIFVERLALRIEDEQMKNCCENDSYKTLFT